MKNKAILFILLFGISIAQSFGQGEEGFITKEVTITGMGCNYLDVNANVSVSLVNDAGQISFNPTQFKIYNYGKETFYYSSWNANEYKTKDEMTALWATVTNTGMYPVEPGKTEYVKFAPFYIDQKDKAKAWIGHLTVKFKK